ncbi:MAG: DUF1467 family protein [Cyanobacteria bacterium J06649_11]
MFHIVGYLGYVECFCEQNIDAVWRLRMDIVSGFTLYAVIWWVVIFMVLPCGVKVPEQQEQGHAGSAPKKANIGKKFLITSLISAVLWGISYVIITEYV